MQKWKNGWHSIRFIQSSITDLCPLCRMTNQPKKKKNPQMSTFHMVSFLISPLWSTLQRVLAILSWWSWFLHHAISSSPSWGKVWTLCISTQSRKRRSRKARAVTRRILSFGCSRRWWLCARVPGRPVDRRSLSAGERQRNSSEGHYTGTKQHPNVSSTDSVLKDQYAGPGHLSNSFSNWGQQIVRWTANCSCH